MGSCYAISRWIYHWIAFQMLVQSILMAAYLLNLAIFNCRETIWCKRLGFTAALIMINDYILNVILFTLFVRKLKQLVESQLTSSMSDMNLQQALEHRNHKYLLNLITKQAVIGTFITVLNQTFATCIFITFSFGSANVALSLAMISYILRGVEGALICFLLYIGLAMNAEDYYRFCKCCHQACYGLCVHKATKSVNRSFIEENRSFVDDSYVEMRDTHSGT